MADRSPDDEIELQASDVDPASIASDATEASVDDEPTGRSTDGSPDASSHASPDGAGVDAFRPFAEEVDTSTGDDEVVVGVGDRSDESARLIFRYLTGDEWRDYRAIMSIFAGTFFNEFSADEVEGRLAAAGHALPPTVVTDRLESLRRWGNLTVSSSVGNPANLRDYYRRRNRYLITRVGQEVHELAEGVLRRVDEVRDVSTSRLRAIRDALIALHDLDVDTIDPERLADAVRAVFDPHVAFTDEITQFFVAINQWQSRYDLTPDEFRFFAEVLVGYVADRLDEIERTARPIGHRLVAIESRVPRILERMSVGLASRVQQAGLDDIVSVTHTAGSTADDWQHLTSWFVTRGHDRSRIDQLSRDAVAAIRTLTMNLTRLSRVGIAASSRRADFLRLAGMFADAHPDEVAMLAAAALGLAPSNHWGVPADDAGDPVPTATAWADAPRANVPVSLRERGNTTNRGRGTPMADRSESQRLLRHRREQEAEDRRRIDAELLAVGTIDGAELSERAFSRLQQLVGRSMPRLGTANTEGRVTDGELTCVIRRRPGTLTTVSNGVGRLRLLDLDVKIVASHRPAGVNPLEPSR